MMNEKIYKKGELVVVPVQITTKVGAPCVKLRKEITDFDIMRNIIYCAMHGQPVIILPKFKDELLAQNAMLQKGIIYKDDSSGQYRFNI